MTYCLTSGVISQSVRYTADSPDKPCDRGYVLRQKQCRQRQLFNLRSTASCIKVSIVTSEKNSPSSINSRGNYRERLKIVESPTVFESNIKKKTNVNEKISVTHRMLEASKNQKNTPLRKLLQTRTRKQKNQQFLSLITTGK